MTVVCANELGNTFKLIEHFEYKETPMKKRILLRLFLSAAALAAFFIPLNTHAAAGDLYMSDLDTGTIFKFSPDGTKSTFASGLNFPTGMAFDSSGNLFVADEGTGAIFKFTPDATKSTFASGQNAPTGLVFDSSGNLFVADFGSGTIFKFTPAGTRSTFASGLLTVAYLAFDGSGNLFATDGGVTVFKFTPAGTRTTFAFGSGLSNAQGLALDGSGNIFVGNIANSDSGTIFKFTTAGSRSTFAAGLNGPIGLAFDASGNLFETDTFSGTIFKFTPDGTKSTFASGLGQPNCLAFEPVTEKLRNISARGLVQTDENVLIAGLIVGGNALANNAVVVRAIGPSLSKSGIANPLQDPTLELHNAGGAIIASNDNWQETQEAQIMASGLAPTDAHESAIFAMLPAGAYTAVARGGG